VQTIAIESVEVRLENELAVPGNQQAVDVEGVVRPGRTRLDPSNESLDAGAVDSGVGERSNGPAIRLRQRWSVLVDSVASAVAGEEARRCRLALAGESQRPVTKEQGDEKLVAFRLVRAVLRYVGCPSTSLLFVSWTLYERSAK
jgi:hypothetical protein